MLKENTKENAIALNEKVANYKLLAREALRMELITPRLSKIANLEVSIKSVMDCKAAIEHEILVENYEISKLDTEHPDYLEMKKEKEEAIIAYNEEVTLHTEGLKELEEVMKEQKEGIAKIESGETKVSIEALNELVSKMIEQSALNAVAEVK